MGIKPIFNFSSKGVLATITISVVVVVIGIFTFYLDTWGKQEAINAKVEERYINNVLIISDTKKDVKEIKDSINKIKEEQIEQKLNLVYIKEKIDKIIDKELW